MYNNRGVINKVLLLVMILFLMTVSTLSTVYAQTETEKYLLPPDDPTIKKTPEPYQPDEFASWSYFVYRFIAVSVGVFPIAVLVSSIGYDSYKTAIESEKSGQFEQIYLPLFLGGSEKPSYTSDEVGIVLLSALGISLAVSTIDIIIAIVRDAQSRSLEKLFREDSYKNRKNVL